MLFRRKYIKAVQSDKELRGLYNTLRVKTKALGSLHEGVRKRQASCSIGDTDNTKVRGIEFYRNKLTQAQMNEPWR